MITLFKKLFKSKKKEESTVLYAPVDGELIALEEVPDPVFSEKMMGDGIAIKPANGSVVSPVQGEVVQVFPTKHAVGIKTDNGVEVLIHIGLETVSLDGQGFTAYIQEGDKVKPGDKLITFDKAVIDEKAKSSITPMIITNADDVGDIQVNDQTQVSAGKSEVLTLLVQKER